MHPPSTQTPCIPPTHSHTHARTLSLPQLSRLNTPPPPRARSVTTFSSQYDGDRFFTTLADGTRVATPLLLVLAVVELSDVVFAVDSIPAVSGREVVCVYVCV